MSVARLMCGTARRTVGPSPANSSCFSVTTFEAYARPSQTPMMVDAIKLERCRSLACSNKRPLAAAAA
jgi:hypothetical protein